MKKITIILLAMFIFNQTFACLNGEIKELKDGTTLYEDGENVVPYGHNFGSDEGFKTSIKQLDSLYLKTKDLDYLSDKGLVLILLKEYKEAIKLYLEIEKIEPNRYSTASNLGTAYELLGQNENALKWIKKSVKLDPKSHNSSEWIHVKILEAKIKGKNFYTTNFLLNTKFGSDIRPNSKLTKQQLQDFSKALFYQLNERVSFVKPKEEIVAQLLFDLGNIAFLLGEYSIATSDYEQAKRYGFKGKLIERRIKETEKLSKIPNSTISSPKNKSVQYNSKTSNLTIGFITIGIILLTLAIIIIYKRRKINKN